MEPGFELFEQPFENGAAPVVIVGGGLAGLTAAAILARAGRPVVVCERAATLGGRAARPRHRGSRLTPRAPPSGGPAAGGLPPLALPVAGGAPPDGWPIRGDRLHTFPAGAVSLLT